MQNISVTVYKNESVWDRSFITVSIELSLLLKNLQNKYTFDNFHKIIESCWIHYKSNFSYGLNCLLVTLLNIDRHLSDKDEIFVEISMQQ